MNRQPYLNGLVKSSPALMGVLKSYGQPTKAQRAFITTIENEFGVKFDGNNIQHAKKFIAYWKPKLEEKQR